MKGVSTEMRRPMWRRAVCWTALLGGVVAIAGCGADPQGPQHLKVDLLLQFKPQPGLLAECLEVLETGGVQAVVYEDEYEVLIMVATPQVPVGRELLLQGGSVTNKAMELHDEAQALYPWNQLTRGRTQILTMPGFDPLIREARDTLHDIDIDATIYVFRGFSSLIVPHGDATRAIEALRLDPAFHRLLEAQEED